MTAKRFLVLVVLIDLFILFSLFLTSSNIVELDKNFTSERGPLTSISFVQLIVCALAAWNIFKVRASGPITIKSSFLVWLFISIGFIFFAFDEICLFHENIDFKIHSLFHIKETNLTDRIDDILIGVYALVGLFILNVYKKEVRLYKKVLPLFITVVISAFVMVGLDLLSSHSDVFMFFLHNINLSYMLKYWCGIFEEGLKIITEGLMIGLFGYCYSIAKKV